MVNKFLTVALAKNLNINLIQVEIKTCCCFKTKKHQFLKREIGVKLKKYYVEKLNQQRPKLKQYLL